MKDDYELTPARASREIGRWTPTVLQACLAAVLVVTAGILLPGYFIGGWFQQHSIQRTYTNTVSSMSYQVALLQEMGTHIGNITGSGGLAATRNSVPASSPEQVNLRAQELGEISQLCSEAVNFVPGIAPGSQQVNTIVTANCLAGAPVSAPPLASPVPEGQ